MPSTSRDRALLIVELLARHVAGLPMSEIADRLSIPRTAAHRLLGDLKEMGYVKQSATTSQYSLTLRLASVGLSYLAACGITDAAQPLLDELAEKTGELARLAVLEGDHLTWVAKAQPTRFGLRYDPDSGADVYLPATANGLALLAAFDDDRALGMIASQGMERVSQMGPGAPKTMRELMERVTATRERGYGVVFDAYEAGTSAVAAVVSAKQNREPIGTVSIAGPSVRFTPERIEPLAKLVRECADEMAEVSASSAAFARR